MIVGVDLDGVCYDFTDALRQYAHTEFSKPLDQMGPAMSWDFPVHDWGWTMEEFLGVFEAGVNDREVFRYGIPYEGVVEGMAALRAAGHHVHIVTHREQIGRREVSIESTAAWLASWGIEYDSITFTKSKPVVKADVFIEDNLKNFLELWQAGIPTFLRTQLYNAEPVWPDFPQVEAKWRVNSFAEFVEGVAREVEMRAAFGDRDAHNLFDGSVA